LQYTSPHGGNITISGEYMKSGRYYYCYSW
jgi:hypothetical protein